MYGPAQLFYHAIKCRVLKTCAQELSRLSDESNVYKLMGPVLLKQDRSEANLTVNRRLDFIDNEM